MTNGNGNTAVKQFNEGAATDSVQFRSNGEAPLAGQPILFDGIAIRVWNEADEMPVWWCRERDRFLRTRLHGNTIVSGVVYGESTRVKNMPYTLTHEDDDQDALAKWQKVLQLAEYGQGFPAFLSKIATDYQTQDNGSFFEILGDGETAYVDETFYRRVMENSVERLEPYKTRFIAKGERTGEATGIAYMDSAQCWRTANPEWPVIYTNPYTGQMTVLHWTRVSFQAQFPQGYELGRGIGLCALSRTYEYIRLLKSINTYTFEKITGRSPEIFFANQPVSKLDQALQAGILNNLNKGLTTFQDPTILAPKAGGVGAHELKFGKLGLLDVPDGFSHKEQVDIAVQAIALGFGVDVREIWAAMSTGATKADAEVQDIKTTGKGRADILSYVENEINWRVLPPEITFRFDEVDDLADKRKAEIKQIRVNTRATQIQSGELNLQEAREMAAEYDDILPEFLERVATADEMTDVEAVNATSGGVAPKEADPAADGEAEEKNVKKKNEATGVKLYSQTRARFFRNLVTFCELAVNDQISSRNFMSSLKGELRLAGRAAFLDGVRVGAGSFGFGENELSPDEIALREGLIATQISYAGNLRDFAFSDPPPAFADMIGRVALWANKGLDGIYNAGKLAGAGNKIMKWKLGYTEKHCKTCLAASEQRHRAKTWAKHKIIPKGDTLVCGGYNCDCEFEETTEGVAGRIDRIPIADKKHDHSSH